MSLKHTSHKSQSLISTAILLVLLLAACTPAETANTDLSPVNTATNAPTDIAKNTAAATYTITPKPTYTSTITSTPTPTLSPEEAAQAAQEAIRAEVLSYGINLDDLANSDNDYINNHPKVSSWQTELDHAFDSTEVDWETMVVLETEQLHSEAEYKRAVTTDGGWKFIVWAKVAYKTSDHLWATANLPLYAYNEGTEIVWIKYPAVAQPWLWEDWQVQAILNGISSSTPNAYISLAQEVFRMYGDYRLDTGTIFKLYTEYPDPASGAGAGEVGEPPRYSAEQLELFRLTGDASIFEYQAADGSYFIWPFYDFDAAISSLNY